MNQHTLSSIALFLLILSATSWATDSVPGYCLDFDQTYDKMSMPDAPGLNFGDGPFTIECWIRNTNTPGSQWKRIAGKRGYGTYWYSLGLGAYGSNQLFLELNSPAGYFLTGASPAIQGDSLWHHVAAVRDETGQILLYVDGWAYPVGTHPGYLDNGDAFEVGIFGDETYGGESYRGQIEELRLWNSARTTQQIREHAHLTLLGTEPGLAAYWQFNEESGDTAYDAVGDNHGSLIGAERIASAVAVGGGLSSTHVVNGTGMYEFTGTGLELNYTAFTGLDTVAVTRLNLAPNLLPDWDQVFDSQYWVIHSYGTGSYTADLSCAVVEELNERDELLPGQLQLHSRSANGTDGWDIKAYAAAVDSAAHSITFSALDSFSQLLLSRQTTPLLITHTPADNETEVRPDQNLLLTFYTDVFPGPGTIAIMNTAPDTVYEAIFASAASIAGHLVTLDPGLEFLAGTEYHVLIDGNSFEDGSGVFFEGISDPQQWNFTAAEIFILELFPADDATDVPLNTSLRTTFNLPVAAGPGSVRIRLAVDGTLVEEFAAVALTIQDSLVLIEPSQDFLPATGYYVEVDSTAFHDSGDLYYGGLLDPGDWNFLTEDLTIMELFPADEAVDVPLNTFLSIAFNLPVVAGPGNVRIRLTADGALVEEFAAAALTIEDSLVQIEPSQDFLPGCGYYVEIDDDAFSYNGSYFFPGISDPAAWDFYTVPRFIDTGVPLPGVAAGAVAWGDYDNDGDLDLLLTGAAESEYLSRIYRNDTGSFVDIDAGLTGVDYSSVCWGDYDNDGDLDLLMAGETESEFLTRVYRNHNGTFAGIAAGLPGLFCSSVAWGDYDNDGDLDILLTGHTYTERISRIYQNDNGVFTDIHAGLPGLWCGSVAWGDYDGDSDLDLLLTGEDESENPITRVYRNVNGSLEDAAAGLIGVAGPACWGDYDNDGDLDILLTGYTGSGSISRIYQNDNGVFTDIVAGLPGLSGGSAQWGDYDNDGDLDLALTGETDSEAVSRIYRNDGGTFTDIAANLPGVEIGSSAWSDYDCDGDLDFVLSGRTASYELITRLYINNSPVANTPPSAPGNLEVIAGSGTLSLSWSDGADVETPAAGLSYNLQIGTPDYHFACKTGMVDPDSGFPLVPALGNVNQVNSWVLQCQFLPEPFYTHESRTIVASIQAVDHTWAGSLLTPDTLILNDSIEYLELMNDPVMGPDDLLSWELTPGEAVEGFRLQVAVEPGFTSPLSETWIALVGARESREVYLGISLEDLDGYELIEEGVFHYWRIRPIYNDPWRYTVFSETPGEFILTEPPDPPQSFTISVEAEVVTLSWDPVPGNFVYYIIYSSTEALAPFPDGWQAESPPTTDTTWQDPEPATGQKFYCVKAVVVE